jgi:hypothetical protein
MTLHLATRDELRQKVADSIDNEEDDENEAGKLLPSPAPSEGVLIEGLE